MKGVVDMEKSLDFHISTDRRDKCKDCKYSDLCTSICVDIQSNRAYRAMRLNDTMMKSLELVGYWMTHGKKPDVENIHTRLDACACLLQTIFGVDLDKIERWYRND